MSVKSKWLMLHAEVQSELEILSAVEFWNADDGYHPVRSKIFALIHAIEVNDQKFQELLGSGIKSGAELWLPLNLTELEKMPVSEIHIRTRINLSGERWVQGAIVPSFTSGVLLAALDALSKSIDQFEFLDLDQFPDNVREYLE